MTLEFSKAIQKARDLTQDAITLIVVTSDHSAGFSTSPIALSRRNIIEEVESAKYGESYSMSSYATETPYESEPVRRTDNLMSHTRE